MENSRYVGVIEGEEVRRDDPIEYSIPMGIGSIFRVPEEVMAIKVLQNEKISGGGKDGGREGIVSAIRRRGANSGSMNIKERE